jgi:hypothetical protein
MADPRWQEIIESAARHAKAPEPTSVLRRRLRRHRQRRAVVGFVALLVVGVAVPGGFRVVDEHEAATSKPTSPSETLECGGVEFPATAMRGSKDAERGSDVAARTLARFLDTSDARNPVPMPRTGWQVLTAAGDHVLYGHGDQPGRIDRTILVSRRDPISGRSGISWRARAWRTCTPERVVAGFEVASWQLDGRVSPASRVVPLRVVTSRCASGTDRKPADARLDHVDVEVSGDAVTITALLRPQVSSSTGPWFCEQVRDTLHGQATLAEPLGRRALRDGATVPPTVIRSG